MGWMGLEGLVVIFVWSFRVEVWLVDLGNLRNEVNDVKVCDISGVLWL